MPKTSENKELEVVLVVDDEPSICWAFEKMLKQEGHAVLIASSAEEGLQLAHQYRVRLVVLDVRLPKRDGISALPDFIKATHGAPVIVMTAFGDLETAISAVQQGASDYLTKPFRLEDALRACRLALDSTATMHSSPTKNVNLPNETLVGKSPAMQQVFRQIALVADSDLAVLITGETGTGKELVAGLIHRHSRRADQPLYPVSSITFHSDNGDVELFGQAETGDSTTTQSGLLEIADGGTIILDEIGELPLATQAKLLRVLEHGQFFRAGDVQPRSTDVRILATTRWNLHEVVSEGRFREDLFYRLTGVHIHLPSLRERTDDIPLLCKYFLTTLGYSNPDELLDQELMNELADRPWHGNVRELRQALHHAVVVARGRALTIRDFPDPQPGRERKDTDQEISLDRAVTSWARTTLPRVRVGIDSLHEMFLAASEPALLRIVLEQTSGNRAKAAELLGIHRGTLRDRLRAYGLDDPSSTN